MGGTDQMDQNIACYRIGIGRKTILLAFQNRWILYNKTGRKKIS